MKNTNNHFKGQSFFIGIDVHKKNWTVTIRSNGLELRTFSMNPSPNELYKHMTRNYPGGSYYSVYEAGFSGFNTHRSLGKLGLKNIVINPADVPTKHKEKSRKRDKVDSRKLCRELENGSLDPIYVPNESIQQLRSLNRLRQQTVKSQCRTKNRIQSLLHYNGIPIVENSEMSHWSKKYIQWLNSLDFSHAPGDETLSYLVEELYSHRKRLVKILRSLRKFSREYGIEEKLTLLRSIPGIAFVTAITLYVEIIDIDRFKNLDHLASFVGLVPSVASSGETEKVKGLTKRKCVYLRNLLIEAAWVAVRKDPAMTLSYNNLNKRMCKQKTIIHIAKKLLNRIRYVLKNNKPYVIAVIE